MWGPVGSWRFSLPTACIAFGGAFASWSICWSVSWTGVPSSYGVCACLEGFDHQFVYLMGCTELTEQDMQSQFLQSRSQFLRCISCKWVLHLRKYLMAGDVERQHRHIDSKMIVNVTQCTVLALNQIGVGTVRTCTRSDPPEVDGSVCEFG